MFLLHVCLSVRRKTGPMNANIENSSLERVNTIVFLRVCVCGCWYLSLSLSLSIATSHMFLVYYSYYFSVPSFALFLFPFTATIRINTYNILLSSWRKGIVDWWECRRYFGQVVCDIMLLVIRKQTCEFYFSCKDKENYENEINSFFAQNERE